MFEDQIEMLERPKQSQKEMFLTMDMSDATQWIEKKFSTLLLNCRDKRKLVGGFTVELPLDEFIDFAGMSEDLREFLSQDLQIKYYEGSSGQRLLNLISLSSSYPNYPFLTVNLANNSISSRYFDVGEIVGYLDLFKTNPLMKAWRQTIIDYLKSRGINESEIQAARTNVRAKIDEFRQLLEKIRSSPKILKKKIALPSEEETLVIFQGEYSATGGEGKKRYLGTYGLGDCIAVVFYNPDTHQAALAHVDSKTRFYPGYLIAKISEDPKQQLQCYLVGGFTKGALGTLRTIVKTIPEDRVCIKGIDTGVQPGVAMKEIVFDTQTGEIFYTNGLAGYDKKSKLEKQAESLAVLSGSELRYKFDPRGL